MGGSETAKEEEGGMWWGGEGGSTAAGRDGQSVHYVATAKVPGVSEVVGAEQAKASTGKLSPPRAASGINDAQAQEGGGSHTSTNHV